MTHLIRFLILSCLFVVILGCGHPAPPEPTEPIDPDKGGALKGKPTKATK